MRVRGPVTDAEVQARVDGDALGQEDVRQDEVVGGEREIPGSLGTLTNRDLPEWPQPATGYKVREHTFGNIEQHNR